MINVGELHAYVGAMGVGKTSLLCERFAKDVEDGLTVLAVKPIIDNRDLDMYSIKSRRGHSIPSVPIESLEELFETDLTGIDKIYVDEIQFFGTVDDVEAIFDLNMKGIDVEVYGLDLNAYSEDFGVMGLLLARADVVFKLTSKCPVCNEHPIRFTANMNGISEDEVQVGDIGDYKPMCKVCYKRHMVDSLNDLLESQFVGDSELSPHPSLENVTIISEDMYIVELGEEDSEFYVKLIVRPSVLEEIGWTVEDVADIIDVDTVSRLLEEVEELKNE